MKKSSVLMIALAAVLTSCGTFAQLASSGEGQQFSDGIYSNSPDMMSRAEKAERKAETDALIEQTKESPIYLFGDRKDTVMIPDNYSATIRYDKQLSSTVVTVQENPYDWRNNLNPWSYYTPFNVGLTWSWGRHWGPSWSIYWGGWYDPYWYGYHHHHHHYCGWYGGWDPHWGHHGHGPGYGPGHRPDAGRDRWYGPRMATEKNRDKGGRQTAAPGKGREMGTSSNRQRVVTNRGGSSNDRLVSSERAVTAKRTAVAAKPVSGSSITRQPARQIEKTPVTGTVSRQPAGSTGKIQSGAISRQPAGSVSRVPSTAGKVSASGKPANHRKPAAVTSGSSEHKGTAGISSGSQTLRRPSSSVDRTPSSYERSSSSSSFNRSSSPSRSSGFSGGGGISRSSFSGGGGHSRSSSGRR